MTKITLTKLPLFAAGLGLLSTLALPACTDDGSADVDAIASSLELENGGFTMTDEQPAFGDMDLTTEFPDEAIVEDPMEQDSEVTTMMNDANAVLFHVELLWGQLPIDPTNDTPHNWSGELRVNRGAIILRHTIAFEPATDSILPRTSPRSLAFRSATMPAVDGLRLLVIDPHPGDGPLVISYRTPAGAVFELPMAALVNGPLNVVVDDANNRIVGTAMPQIVDVCSHGFLRGAWRKFADGRGRLRGVVRNQFGELLGHVKGLYGRRQNGEKVFFMKYIRRDGTFWGIARGHYGDNHFAGHWFNRSGEAGALGGRYTEDLVPGPQAAGHFLGRWREATCNVPVGPGTPVDGEPNPDESTTN